MKKQLDLKTLTTFFVGFWIIGILMHESAHLTINNLFGGSGMIHYNYTWNTCHPMWAIFPEENAWLVFLAGGIITALFFFVFFWLPARIGQYTDLKTAAGFHIFAHLFLAPAELIFYLKEIKLYQWPLLITYILTGIAFLIIIKKKRRNDIENSA